jgi:hypothetical protein
MGLCRAAFGGFACSTAFSIGGLVALTSAPSRFWWSVIPRTPERRRIAQAALTGRTTARVRPCPATVAQCAFPG